MAANYMKKQTRKEAHRNRATRYGDAQVLKGGLVDPARDWMSGYAAALKDVRRAAGRCGIPSRLVKLLRPIR